MASLIAAILTVIAALLKYYSQKAEDSAQKIITRQQAKVDVANKRAAEAIVRAADAEAKSDVKDKTLDDFSRGGTDW